MKLKENSSQIETIRNLIVGSDIKKIYQRFDSLEQLYAFKSKKDMTKIEKTMQKLEKSIISLDKSVSQLEDSIEHNNEEMLLKLDKINKKLNKVLDIKMNKEKFQKALYEVAKSL